MVRKIALLVPVIIAAGIIGSLGIIFIPGEVKNKPLDFPKGTIRIDNEVIYVEIAESAAERQRWLTFRDEQMPLNSAMILVYENPDLYSLWLLNIQFELDLLWVAENGEIVYIVQGAEPCKNAFDATKCTYKNTEPAKYIIASPSGFVDKHNITKNSKVTIISI